VAVVSRTLLGEPLRSDRLEETLLPKRLALPVFCSDPAREEQRNGIRR
jgi:hypothetical protein